MRHLSIIAALAILSPILTGCGNDGHDKTGSIRTEPETNVTTEYDPFESDEFRHEISDKSTRIKTPGFSTAYNPGIIVERGEHTITFTDLSTNRRARVSLPRRLAPGDYHDAELIINGQPIGLKSLRVHTCTESHIAILALTAENAPIVIVVSDL